MSTEVSERDEQISRLISDYNEAVVDEKDAASRVDTAANELRDLGVDVDTDPRTESHA